MAARLGSEEIPPPTFPPTFAGPQRPRLSRSTAFAASGTAPTIFGISSTPFMALPRPKKGVSCSGVPGLRCAAVGMLQRALASPSLPLSPIRPPSLAKPSLALCGPAPAEGQAAPGSRTLRSAVGLALGRGSPWAPKGRWRTGLPALPRCWLLFVFVNRD